MAFISLSFAHKTKTEDSTSIEKYFVQFNIVAIEMILNWYLLLIFALLCVISNMKYKTTTTSFSVLSVQCAIVYISVNMLS